MKRKDKQKSKQDTTSLQRLPKNADTKGGQSLQQISGSQSQAFTNRLVSQVAFTISGYAQNTDPQKALHKEVTSQVFQDLFPNDPLEAMLVAQMSAVHNCAMDCLATSQIANVSSLHIKESMVNQGVKLTKVYAQLMDIHMRYRQRDMPTPSPLSVGRVDVHKGGQAIVGNLTSHPLATTAKEVRTKNDSLDEEKNK